MLWLRHGVCWDSGRSMGTEYPVIEASDVEITHTLLGGLLLAQESLPLLNPEWARR